MMMMIMMMMALLGSLFINLQVEELPARLVELLGLKHRLYCYEVMIMMMMMMVTGMVLSGLGHGGRAADLQPRGGRGPVPPPLLRPRPRPRQGGAQDHLI